MAPLVQMSISSAFMTELAVCSIRQLSAAEGSLLRSLRLAALREAPAQFGDTHEAALTRSDDAWRDLAEATHVAEVLGEPVGMVFAFPDPTELATGRWNDAGRPHATAFSTNAAYICGDQVLEKVPLSGAGPQLRLALPNSCSAVVVQGDFVYWLGQSDSTSTSLALRRTPVDGSGNPQVLADDLRVVANNYSFGQLEYQSRNLTVDADLVYWSEGSLYGSIVRCPITGCTGSPELVAEPVRSPSGLLIDRGTLYFQHDTSEAGWAISTLVLPSGLPSEPLARGIDAESALATDEDYLYTASTDQTLSEHGTWLDPWASIRRIPKSSKGQQ